MQCLCFQLLKYTWIVKFLPFCSNKHSSAEAELQRHRDQCNIGHLWLTTETWWSRTTQSPTPAITTTGIRIWQAYAACMRGLGKAVSNLQNCSGAQQTLILEVNRRSGEGKQDQHRSSRCQLLRRCVKQEAASMQVPLNEHSVVPNGSHRSPWAKAKVLKRWIASARVRTWLYKGGPGKPYYRSGLRLGGTSRSTQTYIEDRRSE